MSTESYTPPLWGLTGVQRSSPPRPCPVHDSAPLHAQQAPSRLPPAVSAPPGQPVAQPALAAQRVTGPGPPAPGVMGLLQQHSGNARATWATSQPLPSAGVQLAVPACSEDGTLHSRRVAHKLDLSNVWTAGTSADVQQQQQPFQLGSSPLLPAVELCNALSTRNTGASTSPAGQVDSWAMLHQLPPDVLEKVLLSADGQQQDLNQQQQPLASLAEDSLAADTEQAKALLALVNSSTGMDTCDLPTARDIYIQHGRDLNRAANALCELFGSTQIEECSTPPTHQGLLQVDHLDQWGTGGSNITTAATTHSHQQPPARWQGGTVLAPVFDMSAFQDPSIDSDAAAAFLMAGGAEALEGFTVAATTPSAAASGAATSHPSTQPSPLATPQREPREGMLLDEWGSLQQQPAEPQQQQGVEATAADPMGMPLDTWGWTAEDAAREAFNEALTELKIAFPDRSEGELRAVLEASDGVFAAAAEIVLRHQEEEESTRLAEVIADEEYAQQLQDQEEGQLRSEQGEGQAQQVQGQAQQVQGQAQQVQGQGQQVQGQGQQQQGAARKPSSPSATQWLSRSEDGSLAAQAAQEQLRQRRAVAQAQGLQGGRAGRERSPATRSESGSESSGSHGRQQLVAQARQSPGKSPNPWRHSAAGSGSGAGAGLEGTPRKVALLARQFGGGQDLLEDVLASCDGDLQRARETLLAMGLQQVPKQGVDAGGAAGAGAGGSQQREAQRVPSAAWPTLLQANQAGRPGAAAAAGGSVPPPPGAGGAGYHAGGAGAPPRLSVPPSPPAAALWPAMAMVPGRHLPQSRRTHDQRQALFNRFMGSGDPELVALREERDRLFQEVAEAQADLERRGSRDPVALQRIQALLHKKRGVSERIKELMGSNQAKLYVEQQRHVANSWEVDLHGLFVDEAITATRDNIKFFMPLPSKKAIKLITGRGAHSPGEPKLLHAVRSYLDQEGHEYEEGVGFFIVYLPAPAAAPGMGKGPQGTSGSGTASPSGGMARGGGVLVSRASPLRPGSPNLGHHHRQSTPASVYG